MEEEEIEGGAIIDEGARGAASQLPKTSGNRVGLLVNFAHPKAEIRRFVL